MNFSKLAFMILAAVVFTGTVAMAQQDTNIAGAARNPSPVDGIWLGALKPGLRIQLHIQSDRDGRESCTADSLDQGAMGLGCANVTLAGSDFSFEIPVVRGSWKGELSANGKTLTGTWNQGSPLPLNFERQAVALAAKPVPPPTYDPALGPVAVSDLQQVLDRDLAAALKNGALAPGTDAGVSIGVVQHGVRKIFTYGTAKPDSIFEIGSVSKTFTGLILSQMVLQGKVKFDEPVRELLPAGTVAKPAGEEITLLDLATQHSGLPRMPDNFHPADKNNPYADYGPAELYAFMAKQGVAKPAKTDFVYSNLGVGLLGQLLANRAGVTYSELLKAEIAEPLGLKDTVIHLSPEQMGRFIQGHDGQHRPVQAWDLGALAGAGAIRSTAGDMLTYLEANLHPEKAAAGTTASGKTLPAALVQDHELHADIGPGGRIALAWLYKTDEGSYWHNGATGGYSSFVLFNPEKDLAVVVLFNTTVSSGVFADTLGQRIAQRLTGKPAISLGAN
jgi:serine-type D-Ala-D-Ala carboxypeptidase/endopeptidase